MIKIKKINKNPTYNVKLPVKPFGLFFLFSRRIKLTRRLLPEWKPRRPPLTNTLSLDSPFQSKLDRHLSLCLSLSALIVTAYLVVNLPLREQREPEVGEGSKA